MRAVTVLKWDRPPRQQLRPFTAIKPGIKRASTLSAAGCILTDCSFQPIAELPDAGARAVRVERGARLAAGADRAHHLLANLDHHAAAEKHHVRKLGEH